MSTDKRKQSLYFPETMLKDLQREGIRPDWIKIVTANVSGQHTALALNAKLRYVFGSGGVVLDEH